jgi:hypothetical protein
MIKNGRLRLRKQERFPWFQRVAKRQRWFEGDGNPCRSIAPSFLRELMAGQATATRYSDDNLNASPEHLRQRNCLALASGSNADECCRRPDAVGNMNLITNNAVR